ncbi:MAG: Wzz/FepE/Etk N-terminal domain-containing protein [Verrucomicrobiota bacterium]|nr:Wzz/FepE/Etk N-terminal domain-containing protein [Verrucomicrobiota bacterium]
MSEDPKSSTKYVMVESGPPSDEDEIDFLELIRTLLQEWKTIVSITILCAGLAVVYALYAPEVFKAETLLASAQEEKSGASSALSQFGGLAAMAGVTIPADSNIERVLATLETRVFLKKFIEEKNLLPLIFEDNWDKSSKSWIEIEGQEEITSEDGIIPLQGAIEVDKDKSGLVTLSISWKDPAVAAKWANDLVKQLNEQLRQKAITDSKKRVGYLEQELAKTTLQDMRAVLYNLLESEKQKAMLANVNEDFALEVIDLAVAPETREKPKRKLIVALGGVCGGFLGIFTVFFAQFLQKLKSPNSEAATHS